MREEAQMATMFDNIPGHVGRLEGLDERRMMLVYQHEYGRLAMLRGACSCEIVSGAMPSRPTRSCSTWPIGSRLACS